MAARQTPNPQPGPHAQRARRRLLTGLFLFVVCVLGVDALVGDQGLVATIQGARQYDELAADIARLESANAILREDARRLREDPTAIEEIARRELGLMSPGEKLFIIRDIDPPAGK